VIKDKLAKCEWKSVKELPEPGDFCIVEDHEGNYCIGRFAGKCIYFAPHECGFVATERDAIEMIGDIPFGYPERWTKCGVDSTLEFFYLNDSADYMKISDLYNMEDE